MLNLFFFIIAAGFVTSSSSESINPICDGEPYSKNLINHGCIRYVMGYDITGVTTEVDLTEQHDKIYGPCDCMLACQKRYSTCSSWVWKFADPTNKFRTCTLYSNFNNPPNVTLAYNVAGSINIQLLQPSNNPQGGGPIPQCTQQKTSLADPKCVSGALWYVGKNKFLC